MRKLRKSQFGDYVAVDDVDQDGKILSTPIYLQKGKTVQLLALDVEDNVYVKTKVTFNGNTLDCDGDFVWESPVTELVEYQNGRPLFRAI